MTGHILENWSNKKTKLLNITRNYSHFLLVSGAFPWACCWHQHRWEPGAGLWKTHGSSLRQPSSNSGFSWIFHTELLIYPRASLFAAVFFCLFCEDSWHQMLRPGWEVWDKAKRCVGCLGCFIYRVFWQQTSLPFPCRFWIGDKVSEMSQGDHNSNKHLGDVWHAHFTGRSSSSASLYFFVEISRLGGQYHHFSGQLKSLASGKIPHL